MTTIDGENLTPVQKALVDAQARYHRSVMTFLVVTGLVLASLSCLIIWELIEAQKGREQLRSCIDPTGECSKRSTEQGQSLVSASIVCTNRGFTNIDQALHCVRELMNSR